MAQVTDDVPARVDWLLAYLRGEWEAIPRLANEWNTLDQIDRVHALIDGQVVASNLRSLDDFAARAVLTPVQAERYTRLRALIAKHRPVLQRLMEA